MPTLQKPTFPKDIIEILEANFNKNAPLLQDVPLYRGTKHPNQANSSYSGKEFHGSILPNIASEFTQAYKGNVGYIGTYTIDRERTRFYPNFGLEKAQQGLSVHSMSVAEAERELRPLVAALAAAQSPRERLQASERIEGYIRNNLYESAIPRTNEAGKITRPSALFEYTGDARSTMREAIANNSKPITEANAHTAKLAVVNNPRNIAIFAISNSLNELVAQKDIPFETTEKAFSVLKKVAQSEPKAILAKSQSLSLNELMDRADSLKLTNKQAQLAKVATHLSKWLQTGKPASKLYATEVIGQLAKLEPNSATYGDIDKALETGKLIAKIKTSVASFGKSEGNLTKSGAPEKPAQENSVGRERER